jgi:predicted MFS family arabinose efflux permease
MGKKSESISTKELLVNSTAVLVLLCFLTMYMGHGAIWPYQERMGVFHGFDKNAIGQALGTSMLVWGVLGSGISIIQGLKFKNSMPLILSFVMSIVAAVMLIYGTTYSAYVVASSLVAFSWFYGLPYLKGIMAAIDRDGRVLVAGGVVFPIGLALGPTMAASVVQYSGVVGVAWLGAFCYLICLILIVGPAAKVDKRMSTETR